MNKYRVKFHPIVMDVYAQDERGAMDVAWEAIDNFQWDEYNLETIDKIDDDERFNPINWAVCINCETEDPTVEGGLCEGCFARLVPGEWHSKW